MKWLKLLLVVVSFSLASCTDPTNVPKYPNPDSDTGPPQDKDPDKQGFLLEPMGEFVISYFV